MVGLGIFGAAAGALGGIWLLIDVAHIERGPAGHRASTAVGEVAVIDPEFLVGEHQDLAELLERPAFQQLSRTVVQSEGEVGVISITDVNRALRATELSPR